MLTSMKIRLVLLVVLGVTLVTAMASNRLAAQGTTATLLGTVTDSPGAAIPDAMVRVTNSGTATSQATMTDSQGRYRIPDLPVGQYEVQSEKSDFQIVVHKRIAPAS